MAQAKRKSGGGGKKKSRGWLLLIVGLSIGVAAVYLGQLLLEHNVHHTIAGWFQRGKLAETDKTVKKESDKPKSKFDFYTILPETEASHAEHETKKPPKLTAKVEKPEEAVVYLLQAASFANFEDADALKAKLALSGLSAQIQKVTIEGKGERHRVLLGPYEKPADRDAAIEQLGKLGIKAPLRLTAKKNNAG